MDTKLGAEQAPKSVTLEPGPRLGREIIAKYLLGFDIMRVEGKQRIGFDTRDVVKNTVRHLIGLEIVEEDDEGNRLYFLLVRILRTIIQNPSLSEKLGVGPLECLDYRLAASLVEAIGDDCVRTANKTTEFGGRELDREMGKLFTNLQPMSLQAHDKALNAFLTGDVELAEEVRGLRPGIEKEFERIEQLARSRSLDLVPQILAVASFLRQIYEHSVDISDLAVSKKN
jgi:phosphate uptake regulator